uniref:Glycosyltransferase n=1 Tax=Geobacter metallireducens TaxID=28232 RepID=A0A831U039_GEOME
MSVKVSVLIITYNHEEYVAQAIESVLAQRADFDWEVVVGEDCSTDRTRDILLKYRDQFPERIRLLMPGKNQGMMANFMATYAACRCEYVALLEGDDFWTSPLKLQKQVDFLEANANVAACFHNVRVVHEPATEKDELFLRKIPKPILSLEDVVTSFCIPTCSAMFRRSLVPELPSWFLDMPMGDWPLHVLLAERGSIAYLDDVLASYRVHGGGVWSGQKRLAILDATIRACRIINSYLGERFRRQLARRVALLEYEAFTILMGTGDRHGAFIRVRNALCEAPLNPVVYCKFCMFPLRMLWRTVMGRNGR